MSPALVHGLVNRWLLAHEDWISKGGPDRLALCESWHKVAVEFGAGHPAAMGCLLALVREALDDPEAYVESRPSLPGCGSEWRLRSAKLCKHVATTTDLPRVQVVRAEPTTKWLFSELEALVSGLDNAAARKDATEE